MSLKKLKQLALASACLFVPLTDFAQCENTNGDFETYTGTDPLPISYNNEAINDDLPGWFVSHGSPDIRTYPTNTVISMVSAALYDHSEGVFTEYNFIAEETYTISYDLHLNGPDHDGAKVYVAGVNGLTATDIEETPITGPLPDYEGIVAHDWVGSGPWFGTGPTAWNTYTHTFIPTANLSQLFFHVFETASSPAGYSLAAIDNICITKVDNTPPSDPCKVKPKFEITNGCVTTFTNTTTEFPTGPDFEIMEVIWDFGDGTTGSGDIVNHQYLTPGERTICMTIWATNGEDCCKRTKCVTVEINSICPPCEVIEQAEISLTGVGTSTITFNETALEGTPYGYYWDFGDGTHASGKSTTHTYSSNGTFTTCLKVFYFDQSTKTCCSFEVCQTVTITNAPMAAPGRRPQLIGEQGKKTTAETNLIEDKNIPVISPNPSNGLFSVTTSGENLIQTVHIFDGMGKLIQNINNVDGQTNQEIDLSTYEKGVYIMVINQNGGTNRSLHKVIVQ